MCLLWIYCWRSRAESAGLCIWSVYTTLLRNSSCSDLLGRTFGWSRSWPETCMEPIWSRLRPAPGKRDCSWRLLNAPWWLREEKNCVAEATEELTGRQFRAEADQRRVTHLLIHWFNDLSTHWFILFNTCRHQFAHSLIHWFTDSFTHRLTTSLPYWLIDSWVHWIIGSLLHWFIDIHWLMESLIHWFTYSLAHCFTDSLTLSLIDSLIHWLMVV